MSSLNGSDREVKFNILVALNYRSCFRWSLVLAGLGLFLWSGKKLTERYRRKTLGNGVTQDDRLLLGAGFRRNHRSVNFSRNAAVTS